MRERDDVNCRRPSARAWHYEQKVALNLLDLGGGLLRDLPEIDLFRLANLGLLDFSEMLVCSDPGRERVAEALFLFGDALGPDIVDNFRLGTRPEQKQVIPEWILDRHELILRTVIFMLRVKKVQGG